MTALALVIIVDVFAAAYLLGLVHCRDVAVYQLPRRTPGAALIVDVPPMTVLFDPTLIFADGKVPEDWVPPTLPYVAPSPTIGERQRARGLTVANYLRPALRGRRTDIRPEGGCVVRYRLPEALGGGEVEGLGKTDRAPVNPNLVGLKVDGYYVWVPALALTEVETPLPPEPPVGSVVLDGLGRAWQHVAALPTTEWWWCNHDVADTDWATVQTYGPLTLMVPEATP
jgi:hypothetical protein